MSYNLNMSEIKTAENLTEIPKKKTPDSVDSGDYFGGEYKGLDLERKPLETNKKNEENSLGEKNTAKGNKRSESVVVDNNSNVNKGAVLISINGETTETGQGEEKEKEKQELSDEEWYEQYNGYGY